MSIPPTAYQSRIPLPEPEPLSDHHSVRRIPWRDRPDNPGRLFQNNQTFVALMALHGVAVDSLGLLCEPFDKGRTIENLPLGLGQGFAHLSGQDLVSPDVCDPQILPPSQHRSAFFTG